MYKQILMNAKLESEKGGQETAEWEKSVKEAEVHIGR
jgi:hypothetical protein